MHYNYNPYTPPYISSEELLKRKNKYHKHLYRSRFNAVGLYTILCIICFTVLAVALSEIFRHLNRDIPLPASIDSIPNNILNSVISLLAMGVLSLIIVKISKSKPREVFRFKRIGFVKTFQLVIIGFSICMLSNVITAEFLGSMEDIGINLDKQYDSPLSDTPLEALIYLISVAVIPAITEEMFFRGVILSKLTDFGASFAIIVSSLLFSLMHGNFVQIPFTFFLGLVFGYLTVYSGSMFPAMLIHFFNNAYSVITDLLNTNSDKLNINIVLLNIALISFLVVSMFLGVYSIVAISHKDKEFLKLPAYEGYFDKKTRNRLFLTSPAIIFTIVYFISEAILSLTN